MLTYADVNNVKSVVVESAPQTLMTSIHAQMSSTYMEHIQLPADLKVHKVIQMHAIMHQGRAVYARLVSQRIRGM